MRARMRVLFSVLVVVLRLVGAQFAVRSWRAVNSSFFEVGHRFGVEKDVVSEISGCRFRPRGDGMAVLVGDSGELFEARIRVGRPSEESTSFDVDFSSRSELFPVVENESVDAEGLAFLENQLYVSTELHRHSDGGSPSSLGIVAYDADGSPTANATSFAVPEFFTKRVQNNGGFEALMTMPFEKDNLLMTTTEDALKEDEATARRIIGFKTKKEVSEVVFRASYEASVRDDGTSLGVVDFESLGDTFLALERTYDDETGNVIRLFEVAMGGNNRTDLFVQDADDDWQHVLGTQKKLLFEWTREKPLIVKTGDVSLTVDNYEGICLVPEAFEVNSTTLLAHLILVNDDNGSQQQIGTQFVLVELLFEKPLSKIPSIDDVISLGDVTIAPTTGNPSPMPTGLPTLAPESEPTRSPASEPTGPTFMPTKKPTKSPMNTISPYDPSDDDVDKRKSLGESDDDDDLKEDWLWMLPISLFLLLAAALCSCRSKEPTVIDRSGGTSVQDDDTSGIELSYDVATRKGPKNSRSAKAKYSRVGNGFVPDDDDDDEIDYV